MLRDFWPFLVALWHEWKVLLTGGSIVAVFTLWNLAGKKPLPQSVNWLIVGITLILAAFFAWRRAWIDAGRNIVTLRPAELTKLARNRTSVHAETFVKLYIGKRIIVTATISDVFRASVLGFVFLRTDDIGITLRLPFWGLRQFVPLPKGTVITVAGRIKYIDPGTITLTNCDLVPTPSEVPPPPTPDL